MLFTLNANILRSTKHVHKSTIKCKMMIGEHFEKFNKFEKKNSKNNFCLKLF